MIDKLKKLVKSLIGVRKLIVMYSLLSIAVGFRLSNHINGSEMVELLKVTGAAFFAGNLVERVTEVIKEHIKK